jgi:HEAT repeat protein
MGKLLGIRPPTSANRTEVNSGIRQRAKDSTWAQYNLQKREAKFLQLLNRLGKGTPENRRKTAKEVADMAHLADSPRAKELLAERIGAERVAFVRAHLLRVIRAMASSGIDCKEFLPQIKLILKEGSDFEKMESANALKTIGDRASVPPLAAALEAEPKLLPPAKRAIEDAIASLSEGNQ